MPRSRYAPYIRKFKHQIDGHKERWTVNALAQAIGVSGRCLRAHWSGIPKKLSAEKDRRIPAILGVSCASYDRQRKAWVQ